MRVLAGHHVVELRLQVDARPEQPRAADVHHHVSVVQQQRALVVTREGLQIKKKRQAFRLNIDLWAH